MTYNTHRNGTACYANEFYESGVMNLSDTAGNLYDAVFLDVDGTLLWVDLDVEGYAADLSEYAPDLTSDAAAEPVYQSMKTHIRENINYRTADELREFKRQNAVRTADTLGIEAPKEVLTSVSDRRISFVPYEESVRVLDELKRMGVPMYIVSNWDVLLEEVLEDLGWTGYFEGVVASAVVGSEKPDGEIFEEALRISGIPRNRAVHVGNDVRADIIGAHDAGIDSILVDRHGDSVSPEATYRVRDLTDLPQLVKGNGR